MEYRKFGNTGVMNFPMGFGCMRFPTIEENGKKRIDEAEATKMLRHAIDNGINYVDTAYPYHDGESELVVGRALKDGYREKVKLATKSPIWLIKCPEDFDKYLDEQLEKLQTDHIDFYLLHALNQERWELIVEFKLLERCEQAKKDGKIKFIGFSYHERPDYYETILNGYDKWDFSQIQLNYLDGEYQAGMNGVLKAAAKGLGVVIMEPLKGGKLCNLPSKVTDIFEECNKERTDVEWALDYLWDMKEVGITLSGMSTFQQVEDNLKYAKRAKIGMLTDEEKLTIKKVQNKFSEIEAVPCTQCGYCMPCPIGVDIPNNFTMYNESFMFDTEAETKTNYANMKMNKDSKQAANNCVDCKECIDKCPQSINIPVELVKVDEYLS